MMMRAHPKRQKLRTLLAVDKLWDSGPHATYMTDDLVTKEFIKDNIIGYRQLMQFGDLGLYSTYEAL